MDKRDISEALIALAHGDCPPTLSQSAKSAFDHPAIIRLLFAAANALKQDPKSATKSFRHPNAGTPWSEEQDAALKAQAADGKTVQEMSELHARSELAIMKRLVKLELWQLKVSAKGQARAASIGGH